MQSFSKFILLFSALLMVIILAACGGGNASSVGDVVVGGGADTPEQAVEEFLRAAYAGDVNRAMSFLCSAQRGPMRLVYNDDLPIAYTALEGVEIDLSELLYEIIEETDDTAKISIIGDIRVVRGEEETFINLNERFSSVSLRKEDDLWRVC